jgi:hypothetical protein
MNRMPWAKVNDGKRQTGMRRRVRAMVRMRGILSVDNATERRARDHPIPLTSG